jgi:hypothetical protein
VETSVEGKPAMMVDRNEQAMTEPAQPSTRHKPCTVAEGRAHGSLASNENAVTMAWPD